MPFDFKKILLYLNFIRPLFFFIAGAYFFAFPEKINLEYKYALMVGGIFFSYGIFRAFRAWKDLKQRES